jgi:hypothetical protein
MKLKVAMDRKRKSVFGTNLKVHKNENFVAGALLL